jgi:hypothetical protein
VHNLDKDKAVIANSVPREIGTGEAPHHHFGGDLAVSCCGFASGSEPNVQQISKILNLI